MPRSDMRSALAQAIGLGSAKSGVNHWWTQRASAVALIPLTLWFAAALIAHSASDYASFSIWIRQPHVTLLFIGLLAALFYHSALGLRVIIEDYVHSSMKFAAILLVDIGCAGLALAGILAVTRIQLGH